MTEMERYWGLRAFPFREGTGASGFVKTTVHAEAVARIEQAVREGEPLVWIDGEAGLGKTVVLRQSLLTLRAPRRRVVLASGATDGVDLLADLAEGLGIRIQPGSPWSAARKAIGDAFRLCRFQGQAVVFALDDCHEAIDGQALDHLEHLQARTPTPLTILRAGRDGPTESDGWRPRIRLLPLTRTEAAQYLTAKLAGAGASSIIFTSHALTRLHAHSRGVPRMLDRLAARALREGARRSLERIEPEVVEQCVPDGLLC